MAVPPRILLSNAEEDRLLIEQAAMIERLAARIAELEAVLGVSEIPRVGPGSLIRLEPWQIVRRRGWRIGPWPWSTHAGMVHSFSARCKTRNSSLMAASSVGK
jgi:hypothetical protein